MNMKKIRRGLGAFLLLLAVCLSGFTSGAFAAEPCADGAHDYSVELVKAASGEESGLRRYTCTICGYSYDEEIPPTGHVWGEWTEDEAASCTAEGHRHRVCGHCGRTEEETVPATGHQYEASYSEPTCTEAGRVKYVCALCGDSRTEAGAPALGHVYELTEEQAAAEGQPGYRRFVCRRCGDSYDEAIPALPVAETPEEPEKPEEPEEPLTPPADIPEPAPEPLPVTPEPAAAEAGASALNVYDVAFVGGTVLSAGAAVVLCLPYIRVLRWAKAKKREILRGRRAAD